MRVAILFFLIVFAFSCTNKGKLSDTEDCEPVKAGKITELKESESWMDFSIFLFGTSARGPKIMSASCRSFGMKLTTIVRKDFAFRNCFLVDYSGTPYYCTVAKKRDVIDTSLIEVNPGGVMFMSPRVVSDVDFIGSNNFYENANAAYLFRLFDRDRIVRTQTMLHIYGFNVDVWGKINPIYIYGQPVAECEQVPKTTLESNQFFIKVDYQHSLSCVEGSPVFVRLANNKCANVGLVKSCYANDYKKHAFLKISLFAEQENKVALQSEKK